jgi:hypothetical protein
MFSSIPSISFDVCRLFGNSEVLLVSMFCGRWKFPSQMREIDQEELAPKSVCEPAIALYTSTTSALHWIYILNCTGYKHWWQSDMNAIISILEYFLSLTLSHPRCVFLWNDYDDIFESNIKDWMESMHDSIPHCSFYVIKERSCDGSSLWILCTGGIIDQKM